MIPPAGAPIVADEPGFPAHNRRARRIAIAAGAASLCIAVMQLWDQRDLFDPEGISYLDIADAWLRGDWRAALTGEWSPLYSWLLAAMMWLVNPSPQWEFTAVHVLNVLIFVAAFTSFSVFLRELLRVDIDHPDERPLPVWVWLAFGYALFSWGVVKLIPLYYPEPDLLVSALLYLLLAFLLRLRAGDISWRAAIAFGVLLAIGYFTKAVMFSMAFVFTAVALVLVRRSPKALVRIAAAFILFISLCTPYIAALSTVKGRLTFSDAGRLNYAWDINQVTLWIHWQGENPGHGTPLHPTRKINDDPPMYEFATPLKATYPPWYDPSYWYEGVEVKLDLARQAEVFLDNTKHLLYFLINSPGPATADAKAAGGLAWAYERTPGPLIALLVAMLLLQLGRRPILHDFWGSWFLWLPLAAGLGAYALLHLEGRLTVGFVVALWMVLFHWIARSATAEHRRAFLAMLVTAALAVATTLLPGTVHAARHMARYLTDNAPDAPFFQSGYTHWKIARSLYDAGLRADDPVGSVGYTYGAYWARMARLRVVAEIPQEAMESFRGLDAAGQARVLELFRKTGAKAVVADRPPPVPASGGWQRIGDTQYYFHVFPQAARPQ